jgi:hypothetical protein
MLARDKYRVLEAVREDRLRVDDVVDLRVERDRDPHRALARPILSDGSPRTCAGANTNDGRCRVPLIHRYRIARSF